MTTYLGESMSNFLTGSGDSTGGSKEIPLGIECMGSLKVPSEDRNRTSPFPYGGMRFEFRAVGSSQNVSLVNTVLCTLTAEAFASFATEIEGGKSPREVATEALNKHWKVIFNGNNYDVKNQEMLTKKGVTRIDSGIESICALTKPKNIKVFQEMKVFSEKEIKARQSCLLEHYVGSVEIEALCMIDMINQHVIPSVFNSSAGGEGKLKEFVKNLKGALANIHKEEDEAKKGELARTLRLETMVQIRGHVDEIEAIIPANKWTLPTYTDLLFLDPTYNPG